MILGYLLRSLRKRFRRKSQYEGVATSSKFFNYVYTKKIHFDKARATTEVVAIGSSLADYGFYSPSWERSFNLGLTSSDLSVASELYEKALCGAPNLKVVLLYSAVFVPGFNLAFTSERNRLVLYKHFFGIDYNSRHGVDHKAEAWIQRKINGFVFEAQEANQGFIFNKRHFPRFDVIARANKHLKENQRKPDQMGHFRRLKQRVEKDGKELYLIIPPVRADFRAHLAEIWQRDLFEDFRQLMPQNRILDFYDHGGFTMEDFGDCDHLNEQGAKKLTEMLRSEVVVK